MLMDMVNQHCSVDSGKRLDNMCISANEEAFSVLEDVGVFKPDKGRGGELSWAALAALEAAEKSKTKHPKTFRQQWLECSAAGQQGTETCPRCGQELRTCLRFGGLCRSKQCLEMREKERPKGG